MDVLSILVAVYEELMSIGCFQSHVDVRAPALYKLKTSFSKQKRRTMGVGFHSDSEKWWGFIIWLG